MKRIVFGIISAAVLLTFPMLVGAQETEQRDTVGDGKVNRLDIDIQLVGQGEIRDGGLTSNSDGTQTDDRANFIVGRTRMTIDFQRNSLEIKVVPQHTAIWGQKNDGDFNIYEAWAKYTLPVGLFAQIGRQALSYDDERIIGSDDWAMGAVSHDVVKLGYEGHGHKAHLLLAYNQNPENVAGGTYYVDGGQPYKTMQTLWYHYDLPKTHLGLSLLFMNIGTQGGQSGGEKRTQYQRMTGTHLTYQPKWGDFSASYYRLTGKEEHGARLDAWMAAVKGTVIPSEIYNFTAGFDYLSGDKRFAVPREGMAGLTYHKKMQGFTELYGSHHKFYGMMEFFYIDTYVNGFSPGLQNAYIGTDVTPIKKLTVSAFYHYMATATKLKGIKKTLGHYLDLSACYKPKDNLQLTAGFSLMTGTETMRRLKRASSDNTLRWAWVCLTIDPRILSLRW